MSRARKRHSKSEIAPELNEIYSIEELIGKGTYGIVFKGRDRVLKKQRAIKRVTSVSSGRTNRAEMVILRELGGVDYLPKFYGMVNSPRLGSFSIAMTYFEDEEAFSDYFGEMDVGDIQEYLYCLLKALSRLHSHGWVHRDCKPCNFLVNHGEMNLKREGYLGTVEELEWRCFYSPQFDRQLFSEENHVGIDEYALNGFETDQQGLREYRCRGPARSLIHREIFDESHSKLDMRNAPSERKSKSKSKSKLKMPRIRTRAYRFASKRRFGIGKYLLVDFGLAQRIDDLQKKHRDELKLHAEWNEMDFQVPGVQKRRVSAFTPSVERRGTPGFRSPEILLQSNYQDGRVDVYSVGLILLSLMTGRFPWHRPENDCEHLFEMAKMYGYLPLKRVASKLIRRVVGLNHGADNVFSHSIAPTFESDADVDADAESAGKGVVSRFVRSYLKKMKRKRQKEKEWPQEMFDLLDELLALDIDQRITAEESLRHPFLMKPAHKLNYLPKS